MENRSVGFASKGRVADSFPANGTHCLFRNDAAPGLEEDLLIGCLKVFREQQ